MPRKALDETTRRLPVSEILKMVIEQLEEHYKFTGAISDPVQPTLALPLRSYKLFLVGADGEEATVASSDA